MAVKPNANWIEWQGGKIVRQRVYVDAPPPPLKAR
jgi:hypothetical protein